MPCKAAHGETTGTCVSKSEQVRTPTSLFPQAVLIIAVLRRWPGHEARTPSVCLETCSQQLS